MLAMREQGAFRVRGWVAIGAAVALACVLAGCPPRGSGTARRSTATATPIPANPAIEPVPSAPITNAALISAHGGQTPVAVPFVGARSGATITWGYQVYHQGAKLTPDTHPGMSLAWEYTWRPPAPGVHQGVIHFSWDDPQATDPVLRFSYDREADGPPAGDVDHFPHPLAGVDKRLKLVGVRTNPLSVPLVGDERVPVIALCYDTKPTRLPATTDLSSLTGATQYVVLIDANVFNPGTSTSKPSG